MQTQRSKMFRMANLLSESKNIIDSMARERLELLDQMDDLSIEFNDLQYSIQKQAKIDMATETTDDFNKRDNISNNNITSHLISSQNERLNVMSEIDSKPVSSDGMIVDYKCLQNVKHFKIGSKTSDPTSGDVKTRLYKVMNILRSDESNNAKVSRRYSLKLQKYFNELNKLKFYRRNKTKELRQQHGFFSELRATTVARESNENFEVLNIRELNGLNDINREIKYSDLSNVKLTHKTRGNYESHKKGCVGINLGQEYINHGFPGMQAGIEIAQNLSGHPPKNIKIEQDLMSDIDDVNNNNFKLNKYRSVHFVDSDDGYKFLYPKSNRSENKKNILGNNESNDMNYHDIESIFRKTQKEACLVPSSIGIKSVDVDSHEATANINEKPTIYLNSSYSTLGHYRNDNYTIPETEIKLDRKVIKKNDKKAEYLHETNIVEHKMIPPGSRTSSSSSASMNGHGDFERFLLGKVKKEQYKLEKDILEHKNRLDDEKRKLINFMEKSERNTKNITETIHKYLSGIEQSLLTNSSNNNDYESFHLQNNTSNIRRNIKYKDANNMQTKTNYKNASRGKDWIPQNKLKISSIKNGKAMKPYSKSSSDLVFFTYPLKSSTNEQNGRFQVLKVPSQDRLKYNISDPSSEPVTHFSLYGLRQQNHLYLDTLAYSQICNCPTTERKKICRFSVWDEVN